MNEGLFILAGAGITLAVDKGYDIWKTHRRRRQVRRLMDRWLDATARGSEVASQILLRMGEHLGDLDLIYKAVTVDQLARIAAGPNKGTVSLGISKRGIEEADRIMGTGSNADAKTPREKVQFAGATVAGGLALGAVWVGPLGIAACLLTIAVAVDVYRKPPPSRWG